MRMFLQEARLIVKFEMSRNSYVNSFRVIAAGGVLSTLAKILTQEMACYPVINGIDGREGIFFRW